MLREHSLDDIDLCFVLSTPRQPIPGSVIRAPQPLTPATGIPDFAVSYGLADAVAAAVPINRLVCTADTNLSPVMPLKQLYESAVIAPPKFVSLSRQTSSNR